MLLCCKLQVFLYVYTQKLWWEKGSLYSLYIKPFLGIQWYDRYVTQLLNQRVRKKTVSPSTLKEIIQEQSILDQDLQADALTHMW